jgi:hypothetical protein
LVGDLHAGGDRRIEDGHGAVGADVELVVGSAAVDPDSRRDEAVEDPLADIDPLDVLADVEVDV